jgi:hypothetical protein
MNLKGGSGKVENLMKKQQLHLVELTQVPKLD